MYVCMYICIYNLRTHIHTCTHAHLHDSGRLVLMIRPRFCYVRKILVDFIMPSNQSRDFYDRPIYHQVGLRVKSVISCIYFAPEY